MPKRKFFASSPQPPAKFAKPVLNKRKVFADEEEEDDEKKEEEKPHPKAEQKNNWRDKVIFDNFSLRRSSRIWPFLDIKEPLPKLTCLSSELIQDRKFVAYFREIRAEIHQNYINFRNTRLTGLARKKIVPSLSQILQILEDMCNETMKIEDVNFAVINVVHTMKTIFEKGKAPVLGKGYIGVRDQLRKLFSRQKFKISDEHLFHIWEAFVRHFLVVSADLISAILTLRVDLKTSRPHIIGFSNFEVFNPQTMLSRSDRSALIDAARLLDVLTATMAKRIQPVSFWTVIPCEDVDHLLEHVFEPGLIQLLPVDAKDFLMTWMIGVRKRMRKRLEKGDLLRIIEAVFETSREKNKGKAIRISLNEGPEVGQYLEKIMGNVLNCVDGFDIYSDEWSENVISFLKYPYATALKTKLDMVLMSACDEIPATKRLNSLFSSSMADFHLLKHTRLQLFRFFILFAYATIRHVFRMEGAGILVFDWNIEEEVTDFSMFVEMKKKMPKAETNGNARTPAVEVKTPIRTEIQSETPLTQVMRPRKILLPTPVLAPPPRIPPLMDTHQNPPPQDYYMPPPPPQNFAYQPPRPSSPPPQFFNSNPHPPSSTSSQQFPPQPDMKYPPPPFNQSNFPPPPVQFEQKYEPPARVEQKKQFSFQPLPPSALYVAPTIEPPRIPSVGPSEVTEEELSNARALRTPSVASGGRLNEIDDDDEEDIPKKWKNAYRLTLEWNQDLKDELERVKKRLEKLSS